MMGVLFLLASFFSLFLLVQGQWLDQAGFSIHTPIKIRVMEGCLVVTAETSTKQ
jgi:hypothetical protein